MVKRVKIICAYQCMGLEVKKKKRRYLTVILSLLVGFRAAIQATSIPADPLVYEQQKIRKS